jgi:hypothetical protein
MLRFVLASFLLVFNVSGRCLGRRMSRFNSKLFSWIGGPRCYSRHLNPVTSCGKPMYDQIIAKREEYRGTLGRIVWRARLTSALSLRDEGAGCHRGPFQMSCATDGNT